MGAMADGICWRRAKAPGDRRLLIGERRAYGLCALLLWGLVTAACVRTGFDRSPDAGRSPDDARPDQQREKAEDRPDVGADANRSLEATVVLEQGAPDLGLPPDSAPPADATAPVIVSARDLHLYIADGRYTGALESMACAELDFVDASRTSVEWVQISVGIDHGFLGDLVIKVEAPDSTLTTVLSRAGLRERYDRTDQGDADGSELSDNYPITFRDDSLNDAEELGALISGRELACRDDRICDYAPNPGAGPGNNLADFQGVDPRGTWRVCVGDGADADVGWLEHVTLIIAAR